MQELLGQDKVVSGTDLAVREYREGREAVMAAARTRIILAECEFLCSLQEVLRGEG